MASARTRKLAKDLLIALLNHQGMGGETAEILGRNVGGAYNAILDEISKREPPSDDEDEKLHPPKHA